jgi:FkbH-like protein
LDIRLTATSFLMPGNPAWRSLGDAHCLDFGAFGDWPQALSDPAIETAIAWIVFLDDIVDAETADGADLDALLATVLAPLDARLSLNSQKPTIVAWASPAAGSVIEAARTPSASRRLAARFETALYERARGAPMLHIVPLDQVFAKPGRDRCFDSRNYYAAHCRLSVTGFGCLAAALGEMVHRLTAPARKVLVLDCDNTLWGGVVGEDGVAGLTLGQDGTGSAYVDFQRAIRRLAGRGTVLALASKNEEADIWSVFDGHPGMALKRRDIAAWRINWSEKADNIAALAEELGIGLDSIAFWDDNPIERETVRAALPQVLVLDCPKQVIDWPRALLECADFARFEVTAEDRRKTALYKARAEFVTELTGRADRVGFLRSIQLRPEALPIEPATLARATQLCAKTNQFNLRAQRHGATDLAEIARTDGASALLVRLSDRFGDHGIGRHAIARPTSDPAVAFLDTFLLSCRVLGRHLEAWMLEACIRPLRNRGVRFLAGEFIPRERNAMAAGFLGEHGFAALDTLAAGERDRVATAIAGLARGGKLYVADLKTLDIPHLEIYSHEKIPA